MAPGTPTKAGVPDPLDPSLSPDGKKLKENVDAVLDHDPNVNTHPYLAEEAIKKAKQTIKDATKLSPDQLDAIYTESTDQASKDRKREAINEVIKTEMSEIARKTITAALTKIKTDDDKIKFIYEYLYELTRDSKYQSINPKQTLHEAMQMAALATADLGFVEVSLEFKIEASGEKSTDSIFEQNNPDKIKVKYNQLIGQMYDACVNLGIVPNKFKEVRAKFIEEYEREPISIQDFKLAYEIVRHQESAKPEDIAKDFSIIFLPTLVKEIGKMKLIARDLPYYSARGNRYAESLDKKFNIQRSIQLGEPIHARSIIDLVYRNLDNGNDQDKIYIEDIKYWSDEIEVDTSAKPYTPASIEPLKFRNSFSNFTRTQLKSAGITELYDPKTDKVFYVNDTDALDSKVDPKRLRAQRIEPVIDPSTKKTFIVNTAHGFIDKSQLPIKPDLASIDPAANPMSEAEAKAQGLKQVKNNLAYFLVKDELAYDYAPTITVHGQIVIKDEKGKYYIVDLGHGSGYEVYPTAINVSSVDKSRLQPTLSQLEAQGYIIIKGLSGDYYIANRSQGVQGMPNIILNADEEKIKLGNPPTWFKVRKADAIGKTNPYDTSGNLVDAYKPATPAPSATQAPISAPGPSNNFDAATVFGTTPEEARQAAAEEYIKYLELGETDLHIAKRAREAQVKSVRNEARTKLLRMNLDLNTPEGVKRAIETSLDTYLDSMHQLMVDRAKYRSKESRGWQKAWSSIQKFVRKTTNKRWAVYLSMALNTAAAATTPALGLFSAGLFLTTGLYNTVAINNSTRNISHGLRNWWTSPAESSTDDLYAGLAEVQNYQLKSNPRSNSDDWIEKYAGDYFRVTDIDNGLRKHLKSRIFTMNKSMLDDRSKTNTEKLDAILGSLDKELNNFYDAVEGQNKGWNKKVSMAEVGIAAAIGLGGPMILTKSIMGLIR